jgi:hypothetical protein
MRRVPVRLTVCCGLGTAALLSIVAWNRVEWIERPWLCHQIQSHDALQRSHPDHADLQSQGDNHGMSRYDRLLSRLIRLGRSDFAGKWGFRLIPLQGEQGRIEYLVRYDPLPEGFAFDRAIEPGNEMPSGSIIFDGCTGHTLLAVTAGGRAVGEPLAVRVPDSDERSSLPSSDPASAPKALPLPSRVGCWLCSSRETDGLFATSDVRWISVDSRGIVD